MTVRQLMQMLETFPADMEVFVTSPSGEVLLIEDVNPKLFEDRDVVEISTEDA